MMWPGICQPADIQTASEHLWELQFHVIHFPLALFLFQQGWKIKKERGDALLPASTRVRRDLTWGILLFSVPACLQDYHNVQRWVHGDLTPTTLRLSPLHSHQLFSSNKAGERGKMKPAAASGGTGPQVNTALSQQLGLPCQLVILNSSKKLAFCSSSPPFWTRTFPHPF